MGKDQIDNEVFDDADEAENIAEQKDESPENNQSPSDIEKASENNNEDKFFSPEPDEKNGNSDHEGFFDDSEGEKPLLSEEFEESEEEKLRKKKVKKRAVVISACSVFVVAVCVFAFVFINQYTNKFIMTVDGKKISVEEYKLFYYTSEDSEDVKNSALENLKQLIAIENLAKAKNISLTDEEREEAATNAQSFKEYFVSTGYDMPAVTDDRLAEIMGIDTLYTKLYDLITTDYTVDDSDFDEQYEDYITNYKSYYIDAQYQYIMAETEENAQKAKEAIEAGADINDVMKDYAISYTEGDEVPVLSIYEISYYFAENTVNDLLSLTEGQVSDIIDFSGTYMIFITEYITIPPEEETKESFIEMYYDNKKYYMFLDEIDAFQNESEIKVNQKLLDTFA